MADPSWMAFTLSILLLSVITTSAGEDQSTHYIRDEQLNQRWSRASHEFDNLVWPQRHFVINSLKDIVANQSELQLSNQCADALRVLRNGFEDRKFWSYKCK